MDSALGSSPHRVRVEGMGPTGGSHRSVTQGTEAVRDLLRAADPVRLRGGDGEGCGVARMRSCRVARARCAHAWLGRPGGSGPPAGLLLRKEDAGEMGRREKGGQLGQVGRLRKRRKRKSFPLFYSRVC